MLPDIPEPDDASIRLLPAEQFTIQALTAAYNQTRSDYMIPMPMDAQHLADYIHLYNVDLSRSWVALDGDQVLGLAMLGLRPGRAWVTRLGVLTAARRGGLGGILVRALLDSARAAGCSLAVLEVIQGNQPARRLFEKLGFVETRPLLVLRRPAGPPVEEPAGQARWLEGEPALELLSRYPEPLAWTNEGETYRNAGDALGLELDLPAGARGWLVFRRQPVMLSHFVLRTENGSPGEVCRALMCHLFNRFPRLECYVENLPAADPHALELARQGFREAFRRTEMHLNL